MYREMCEGYELIVFYHDYENNELYTTDGNIDVEVVFLDGRRYGATFFTVDNILTVMSRFKKCGECAHGLYFFTSYPIFVREITIDVICRTIDALLSEEDFEYAFEFFPDE